MTKGYGTTCKRCNKEIVVIEETTNLFNTNSGYYCAICKTEYCTECYEREHINHPVLTNAN